MTATASPLPASRGPASADWPPGARARRGRPAPGGQIVSITIATRRDKQRQRPRRYGAWLGGGGNSKTNEHVRRDPNSPHPGDFGPTSTLGSPPRQPPPPQAPRQPCCALGPLPGASARAPPTPQVTLPLVGFVPKGGGRENGSVRCSGMPGISSPLTHRRISGGRTPANPDATRLTPMRQGVHHSSARGSRHSRARARWPGHGRTPGVPDGALLKYAVRPMLMWRPALAPGSRQLLWGGRRPPGASPSNDM